MSDSFVPELSHYKPGAVKIIHEIEYQNRAPVPFRLILLSLFLPLCLSLSLLEPCEETRLFLFSAAPSLRALLSILFHLETQAA